MTHVEAPPVESIEDFAAQQVDVDKQFLETIDRFKQAESAGTVAMKAAAKAEDDATQTRWDTVGTDKQAPRN